MDGGESPASGLRRDLPSVEVTVGPLRPGELPAAVAVAVAAMHDNPITLAAFGADEGRRRRVFGALMRAAASTWADHAVVARTPDGAVVGVCGGAPPGGGQPSPAEALRLLPALLSTGPGGLARIVRWLGAWAVHDPREPHWHLGPVAVEPTMQGGGVGSRLLTAFCERVDATGEPAYLETDRPLNVAFYRRFGFDVVAEHPVLGVPNWFMLRPSRGVEESRSRGVEESRSR